jgi:type II restriction/modification system DNA methylase subunit YeeA
VLKEKLNRAKNLLEELDKVYDQQRRHLKKPKDWKYWEHPGEPKGKHIAEIMQKEQDVFEILFDIKVLDPAMGSGHFLVHTVDFISDNIITFLSDYPDNPVVRRIDDLRNEIVRNLADQMVRIDESKLTEVNLIKRMVMKRCIYGVDLNEMAVELAKLSLWLDSFTLGAPLSFLDHHLKCGNSLIGILDISGVIIPGTEAYGKVQRALSFMLRVSELIDRFDYLRSQEEL